MTDVIFGQYYPKNSVVHKMDPRVKILLLIAYIAMIFVVKTFYGFALCGLFLLAVVLIAKLPPLKVVRSVRGIIFIIALTFIINIFMHQAPNSVVIFRLWQITITDKSLQFAVFMALRLIFLVLGSCLLTLTTAPVQLTDGIESLLKPLSYIKFPVHELALVMSIALRYISSLMEETQKIISAQKARGAEFESGSLIKRAKALLPVLIPLLVSSFRRAVELGDAMDARCYGQSKKRTKYKQLKMGKYDLFASIFTALFFAGVIVLNICFKSVL